MELHYDYTLIMITHSDTVLLSKTAIEQLLLKTKSVVGQMVPQERQIHKIT